MSAEVQLVHIPVKAKALYKVVGEAERTHRPGLIVLFNGYDDDPRELWEVPVFQAMAREAVTRMGRKLGQFLHEDSRVLLANALLSAGSCSTADLRLLAVSEKFTA